MSPHYKGVWMNDCQCKNANQPFSFGNSSFPLVSSRWLYLLQWAAHIWKHHLLAVCSFHDGLRANSLINNPHSHQSLAMHPFISIGTNSFAHFSSVAQVGVFIYYAVTMEEVGPYSPVPWSSPLIYDPRRRMEAWRFISYMFLHAGWVTLPFPLANELLLCFIGWYTVFFIISLLSWGLAFLVHIWPLWYWTGKLLYRMTFFLLVLFCCAFISFCFVVL